MKRGAAILLICGLSSGLCAVQGRAAPVHAAQPVRAEKFFYSLPEGAPDEWEYSMLECGPVPSPNDFGLRDCRSIGKHQMCASSKSVELTNALNGQKRRFALVYHVFATKAACAKDRKEALKSH